MIHTLVQSLTGPSGQLAASKQYTAAAITELDEVIAAGATNEAISLAVDISQVKSLIITSDQDLTLKTNSSGSPTNTLALKANVPYIWNVDSYDTCKITADVTIAYATNAGADDAALSMRILFDPTP